MKYAVIAVLCILVICSCKKKNERAAVCPASLTGTYKNSISKEILVGGPCTVVITDSTDTLYVVNKTFHQSGNRNFHITINCDSNTITIPRQLSGLSIFTEIYGNGRIYDNMIVLSYSVYDNVEYRRWFDNCTDTLMR